MRLFSTLLRLLLSELERQEAAETASHIAGHRKGDVAKFSELSCQILPSVRQYSSWLLANAAVLMTIDKDEAYSAQLDELWRMYACVLTHLAAVVSGDEMNQARTDYILHEDEITLGFLPFKHIDVSHRYLKDDGIPIGSRHHENGPSMQRHYNTRRIRDLLADGIELQESAVCPPEIPTD